MIKDDVEYRVTRAWAREFRRAVRDLESYEPDQWTSLLIKMYTGEAQELEAQCREYLSGVV